MAKKEIKERIEKLKKEINHHRYLYHVLDRQEISDSALDFLKHELFLLEQKYPKFITPDSPTQRIGGKPLKGFKKIRHIVSQWSFNDAFNEKEIRDFDQRMKKELGIKNIDYTVELKIDGIHIILTYEKGILKTGATRGDGKVGEDVTQNLKTIESIPLKLKKDIDLVAEGEAYMKKSVFLKLNKKREKNEENLFANPRNAAAGGIRQLDSKIAAKRKLDVYIYDYSWPEKDIPKTQFEELNKLIDLGFRVNKNFKRCKNIEEVIKFWRKWEEKKTKEDYWIDGIVVKVDLRKYQNKLGYTGKAPRWVIAFKWPGEQAASKLKNVIFQVGRTGKITPVAVLEAINIGGTTVTRATLHNADEMKRLGIKAGDTIIVEKAGDVIPRIVRVLSGLRSEGAKSEKAQSFQMPHKCPACGSEIKKIKGEVAHYCLNKKCGAVLKNRLYYFVSKKAFDIKGFGPRIIDQLIDGGLISQASDIFSLEEGDLKPLQRFAEKSSSNLIKAIENSKRITLPRFLIACGIKYVGEETANLLARKIQSFYQPAISTGGLEKFQSRDINDIIIFFQKSSKEDIEKIKGIGNKVGKSVKDWFSLTDNIEFLKNLEKIGITLEREILINNEFENKEGKFRDKIFVFTGELKSMPRDEAKKRVRKFGGKITETISKKTNFLVVGKKSGSKLGKAGKFGVKVIREKEFLKLVETDIHG